MLLNKCNHLYFEIHFIFITFISMSRSKSIYVVSMWSIFISRLFFITINHITSFKQRYLFFVYFLEYLQPFLHDNVFASNIKSSVSGCWLAFAWFFASSSLALVIKVLPTKKVLKVIENICSPESKPFNTVFQYINDNFSLFDEIGSHSKKPELFWNIAIAWYMTLSKFSDIVFHFSCDFNLRWTR